VTLPLPSDHFHVGVVVDDVDRATDELSRTLGLHWRPRIRGVSLIRVGELELQFDVDAVYSVQGPTFIELIRARPGTPWARPGLHHLGYWSDDVVAASAELEVSGMPETARFIRDGEVLAVYHRLADGLQMELLPRSSSSRLLGGI
jgi:hypothetical protein